MTEESLTKEEIANKLRTIVSEQLGKEISEVMLQSRFTEDLGADSLDLVELIMAIEEEFDCEVPDTEAAKIKTVSDAVQYIYDQKNKKDDVTSTS